MDWERKKLLEGYTRKRGDCSEEEMCFFNCNNRVEPEGTRGGQDTRKQHIQGGVLASHASFVGMKSGMVIALEEKKLFTLSASAPVFSPFPFFSVSDETFNFFCPTLLVFTPRE